MRTLLLAVALLAGNLTACAPKATNSPCPASFCAGHGTCTNSNTLPTCTCDEGYAGLTCGICEPGYYRSGNDTCAAVEVCTTNLCGSNGTCSVDGGVAVCACAPGYAGVTCTACSPGFLFVPTYVDAGTVTVDGGSTGGDGGLVQGTCVQEQVCTTSACPPFWTCDDTTGAVTCSCENDNCSTCSASTCNGNGTCDDSSGVAVCTSCNAGYSGPTCSDCYVGYLAADGGTCILPKPCMPQTCSGGGLCDDSSGVPVCTCSAGYTGDYCQTCATGYNRSPSDQACVADSICGPGSCPASATCDDSTGVILCPCLSGYAGPGCSLCYPGYHQESAPDAGTSDGGLGASVVCVVDDQCTATSCGTGVCDDSTGTVACTSCAAGWSGNYCEISENACGTQCGAGECVNLQTSYECLCTDGTWGQSCLPGPTITDIEPPSGIELGGTAITLTGNTFDPAGTVTVGGISATFTYVSSTELDIVTPMGTALGAAPVVVTNSNNQTATGTFTYVPVPVTETGADQTFQIPTGVTTLFVQAWGAGGGMGQDPASVGGAGGYAAAHLNVNPGDSYVVVVGAGGAQVTTPESLDAGMGATVDAGPGTAAGAGGGYSGVFLPNADAGVGEGSETALIVAGGGGGAGYAPGENGGNGGGQFGTDGSATDSSAGLGGNNAAGGIGGCLATRQCGRNGTTLQGGNGGVPVIGTPWIDGSYGGGGAVGNGPSFNSAGGGGGYFGGGGGAGGGGGGGGGGTAYVTSAALDSDLENGDTPGNTVHAMDPGYITGVASGGSAMTPAGGNGLVLVSW